MKKLSRKVVALVATLSGIALFASCGTTQNAGATTGSTSSDKEAMKASSVVAPVKSQDEFAVVDWFGRALDEPAAPTWLKNLSRGNADVFKKEKGLEASRIVKLSSATGRTAVRPQVRRSQNK